MHETLLTLADATTTATTTATTAAGILLPGWIVPAVTAGIALVVAVVWADGQRQVALTELSVAAQKEPDRVERALDDIDFLQQQQEKVRTLESVLQVRNK